MLPEIPTVNKCFYSEGKFPRENKTKKNFHSSDEDENNILTQPG